MAPPPFCPFGVADALAAAASPRAEPVRGWAELVAAAAGRDVLDRPLAPLGGRAAVTAVAGLAALALRVPFVAVLAVPAVGLAAVLLATPAVVLVAPVAVLAELELAAGFALPDPDPGRAELWVVARAEPPAAAAAVAVAVAAAASSAVHSSPA